VDLVIRGPAQAALSSCVICLALGGTAYAIDAGSSVGVDAGADVSSSADAGPSTSAPDAGSAEILERPRAAHLPTLLSDLPAPTPPDAGPSPTPGEPPSSEQISRAITGLKPKISQCAEEEHRRKPSWAGTKATAGFSINPDGTVSNARMGNSTIDKSPLGKCLREALTTLSFQHFDGEAFTVEVPLVLNPKLSR
jgi:hypothetical protein